RRRRGRPRAFRDQRGAGQLRQVRPLLPRRRQDPERAVPRRQRLGAVGPRQQPPRRPWPARPLDRDRETGKGGAGNASTMILVVDNYDSFTFNLVHYLMELGAEVRVVRNDEVTAAQAIEGGADGILISPGPCTPNEAGISLDLVAACAEARRPLLGVCLGHQAIGQHFGGKVVRGGLMHGKTSPVDHDGTGVFAGLPSPFIATRYHSLIVEDIPDCLAVNATSETP